MILNISIMKKGKTQQANKKFTWAVLILSGIILALVLVFHSDLYGESINAINKIGCLLPGLEDGLKKQSFLIYIINFNDFMCMSCLNSFLEFYYNLPPPFQTERSLGILIENQQDQHKNRSTSQKIIKKKLSGFIRANRIGFPIFIDSSGSFKYLSENGTAVIVFSEVLERSETYVFPLSSREREKILNTLF